MIEHNEAPARMARTMELLLSATNLLKSHELTLKKEPNNFAYQLMAQSARSRVEELTKNLSDQKEDNSSTETPLTTVLNFPLIFDSLNKVLRKNRWKGKARKDNYVWLVKSMTNNIHSGKVRFEYTRISSATRRMDFDNLARSAKEITDAIVRAGIIKEDNPDIIVERHYEHILIARNMPPYTVIRIIDL